MDPSSFPHLGDKTRLTPAFFKALEILIGRASRGGPSALPKCGAVGEFDATGRIGRKAAAGYELDFAGLSGWTGRGRPVVLAAAARVTVAPNVPVPVAVVLDAADAPHRYHLTTKPPGRDADALSLGEVVVNAGGVTFARRPAVTHFGAIAPFDAGWSAWVAPLAAAIDRLGVAAAEAEGPAADEYRHSAYDLRRDWLTLPVAELVRRFKWLRHLSTGEAFDAAARLTLPDDPTDWPSVVAAALHAAIPAPLRYTRPLSVEGDDEPEGDVRHPAEARFGWDGAMLTATLFGDFAACRGFELRVPESSDPPGGVTFEYRHGSQEAVDGEERDGWVAYPLPAPPEGCDEVSVWPLKRCAPELWVVGQNGS